MTTVCIKMCEKFGDEAEHGNEPYEREIGSREKVFPFKIGDTSTHFCMGGNDSEMARDGGPGVREVMITKGKGECGAGPRRKTGRRDIPLQQQQQQQRECG